MGAPRLDSETWDRTNLDPQPSIHHKNGCPILNSTRSGEFRVGSHKPQPTSFNSARKLPQFFALRECLSLFISSASPPDQEKNPVDQACDPTPACARSTILRQRGNPRPQCGNCARGRFFLSSPGRL